MDGTNDMKKIVIAVFTALILGTAFFATYHYSKEAGVLKGIKAYHKQCYTIGGYIIDDMGHVVLCAPQGTIPKDELPNFKNTL